MCCVVPESTCTAEREGRRGGGHVHLPLSLPPPRKTPVKSCWKIAVQTTRSPFSGGRRNGPQGSETSETRKVTLQHVNLRSDKESNSSACEFAKRRNNERQATQALTSAKSTPKKQWQTHTNAKEMTVPFWAFKKHKRTPACDNMA